MTTWYEDGLRAITIELSDEGMEFREGGTLDKFCEEYEKALTQVFGDDIEVSVTPSDVIGGSPKYVIINDSDLEPEDLRDYINQAWELACEAV